MSLEPGSTAHILAVKTYSRRLGRILMIIGVLIFGMLATLKWTPPDILSPIGPIWGLIATLAFGLALLGLVVIFTLVGANLDLREDLRNKKL